MQRDKIRVFVAADLNNVQLILPRSGDKDAASSRERLALSEHNVAKTIAIIRMH